LDNDQDFVSTREAADMLGVALRTVQLWVERGSLKAWKTVGGHRRVVRSSVQKLLDERSAAIASGRPAAEFRLLVIEDDPRLRRLYEMDVPAWRPPVKLELARDGFEGLLKAGQFKPDLIISDLQVPGMDGFRMIEALRQDPSVMADIVVVTALDAGTILDRGGLAPDLPVLRKPVLLTDIRKLVTDRMAAVAQPNT
jgi:excisionase family DNA binding protein